MARHGLIALMTLPLDTIICGDAVEEMRRLPDASIDLVITSPPYNLKSCGDGRVFSTPHGDIRRTGSPMGKYNYGKGRAKGKRGKEGYAAGITKSYEEHADNLPHADYVAWQRRVLTECLRVLKPTGAIFYNHKIRMQGGLWLPPHDILEGLPVREEIVWATGGGVESEYA